MGMRLRKYRRVAGYSIREAGKLLNMSPSRITQWERGVRVPSIESLIKLAVLYRVTLDEICTDLRKDSAQTIYKNVDISAGEVRESPREKPT